MPGNSQFFGGGPAPVDVKSVPLLDKYLCRICEKWKTPSQFSNKEMNEYRWKKKHGPINGTTARVRCRLCAGDQVHELLCNGPCDLYKSADDFSKSQRSRPEVAWCTACTVWKEACEPTIVPEAAPGTLLSPDEDASAVINQSSAYIFGDDGVEGGSGSDDEDEYDVYRSISEMSVSAEGVSTGRGALPSHLTNSNTSRRGPGGMAASQSQRRPANLSNLGNVFSALSEDNDGSLSQDTYSTSKSATTSSDGPPTPKATRSGFDPNKYRTLPPGSKTAPKRDNGWAKPLGQRRVPPANFAPAVAPNRQGQARRVDDDSDPDVM